MSPVKLEIVQAGNPVLRQRARPLSVAEIRSREIQNLIEAMRAVHARGARRGARRSATGLALQLAVIEDREEYHKEVAEALLRERERRPVPFHVIINPALEEMGEEKAEFFEGCLSLSGFSALVPRARAVRVTCLDERGEHKVIEASGWYARILQHEIDHLNGTLYIDRMRTRPSPHGKSGGVLERQAGERDQVGTGTKSSSKFGSKDNPPRYRPLAGAGIPPAIYRTPEHAETPAGNTGSHESAEFLRAYSVAFLHESGSFADDRGNVCFDPPLRPR